MRVSIREYTVPGVVDAMERALESTQQDLLRAQAEVSALQSILREVNEHCGVDGCVERFWDKDRMLKHREQEHSIPKEVESMVPLS